MYRAGIQSKRLLVERPCLGKAEMTPGAPGYEVQLAYIVDILCPQVKGITVLLRKLSVSQQTQITKKRGDKSLRELARKYGVSHETVRRNLKTGSQQH